MIPRRRRIISTPMNAASRFRSATFPQKETKWRESSKLTQSSIRPVKRRQAKLLIKRHVPMSIVKDTRRSRDGSISESNKKISLDYIYQNQSDGEKGRGILLRKAAMAQISVGIWMNSSVYKKKSKNGGDLMKNWSWYVLT
jgi:hypothetical protein